jgi:hypothetical protein
MKNAESEIKKPLPAISIFNEFKNTPIHDRRIVKRLITTAKTLAKSPGESIPEACQNKAKTKAVYRLLSNSKVNSDDILEGHRSETINRVKQHEIVLSIQDTSLVDYTSHPKTQGVGPTSDGKGLIGLFMHTALAVNTNGTPLGILAQKIWSRTPEEVGKGKSRKQLPIEEKESYKWLEIMDKSLKDIPKTTMVVTVADREADIYELFHKVTTENRQLLIRAKHDRRVDHEQKKLFAQVQSSPVLGKCMIQIPRNTQLNLPSRTVWLMIQSCKVKLCSPQIKGKSLPDIELTAILAREIAPSQEVEPIQWFLLTTLEVTSPDEAIEKVRWYSHRWKIERFHFVLKSACKIEELQLETFERLKNAIALYSFLAWRLIWITYQARETPDVPCTLILADDEWKLLYSQVKGSKYLPKKAPKLKEAVLLIAQLGGFLARKGDGDPGVKVLWRGFRELYTMSRTLQNLKSNPSWF